MKSVRIIAYVVSLFAIAATAWNLAPRPASAAGVPGLVYPALCDSKYCRQLAPIPMGGPTCETCVFDPGGVQHWFCMETTATSCYIPDMSIIWPCIGQCSANLLKPCGADLPICNPNGGP